MNDEPIHVSPIFDTEVKVLNNLCEVINQWATTKGWNEGEDSIMRKSSDIALMHSELSECLEFVRKKLACPNCGKKEYWIEKESQVGQLNRKYFICCCGWEMPTLSLPDDHVPTLTGEAAELADCVIRIFHYCGRRGINLGEAVRLKHEYNITRPYKHGKTL